MNNSVLIVERPDNATAELILNRPDRRNALTLELMGALCVALESLAGEPQRRVVIFRGAGPSFCAGLDLQEAAETDFARQSALWVARTFQTIAASPLVTIAAVHGAAYGGGAGILACCDLAIAAEGLRICFPEVRRGLLPALVVAALRSRLRDGDLRELMLLGEPVDARRALQMGIVRQVVPAERLLTEVRTVAATVLKGGPEAVRRTKRLLGELDSSDLASLIARALDFHKQNGLGDEAREGMAAFREHREPSWTSVIQSIE